MTKFSLSNIIRRKKNSPTVRLGEKGEIFLQAKILCYTELTLLDLCIIPRSIVRYKPVASRSFLCTFMPHQRSYTCNYIVIPLKLASSDVKMKLSLYQTVEYSHPAQVVHILCAWFRAAALESRVSLSHTKLRQGQGEHCEVF